MVDRRSEMAPSPTGIPRQAAQQESDRKPSTIEGGTRGRKLHLSDAIHDRLWLLARQRRVSVSAVAAEILDKNLPHFRVECEG